MELPEEIDRAIDAFEREVRWSEEYGECRDLSVQSSRSSLTAAILSRLREAEAGREEVLAPNGMTLAENYALVSKFADANDVLLIQIKQAKVARDAALARVEGLEKALAFYADEQNYRMNAPLDPNSSWFEGNSRARSALSEAPSQGDQ
ncbi:hypothetical protein ACQKQD_18215 [Methylobacterium sp. NPDC080182]|uniref:hypothetical protein n=1 Tax=Methylobacterium sp. NPDC080182 TaxID=3390590 RepID=UPI003CFCF148